VDEVSNLTSRSLDLITVFQGGNGIVATVLTQDLLGSTDVRSYGVAARPELDGVEYEDVNELANTTNDGYQEETYDGVNELAAGHVVLPVDVLVPKSILTYETRTEQEVCSQEAGCYFQTNFLHNFKL
jgi:hypothetical protein